MYSYSSTPSLSDTTVCGNLPQQIFGDFIEESGNCINETCTTCADCPGDINGDGNVGGADLTILLNAWECNSPSCLGDVNGDEVVDGADLTIILSNWGVCSS